MANLFEELQQLYDGSKADPERTKQSVEERLTATRVRALQEASQFLLASPEAKAEFEASIRRSAQEGYKKCTLLTWDRNNSPKFGSGKAGSSNGLYLLDLLNKYGLVDHLQDFLDETYGDNGSRFLVYYHKLSANSTAFRLVVSWDKDAEDQIRQTLETNAAIAARKQEEREDNKRRREQGEPPRQYHRSERDDRDYDRDHDSRSGDRYHDNGRGRSNYRPSRRSDSYSPVRQHRTEDRYAPRPDTRQRQSKPDREERNSYAPRERREAPRSRRVEQD